jgi:ribosomal protein L16 Arg81 hydroxylase
MQNHDFQNLFLRMIGGDEEYFFRNHWRQRTLLQKSAIPEFVGKYSYHQFIADYRNRNPFQETLVITIDDQGTRRMIRPGLEWSVDDISSRGASLALQALLLPKHHPDTPVPWQYFIDLHHHLSEYLLPDLPEGIQPDGAVAAVDIFCASRGTSTGGHFDMGDVFYFVLDGEREWTVELVPDPQRVIEIALTKDLHMQDHAPRKEHSILRIQPGDCLYVPPHTYHRVSSQGPSLAVSIGLPAYTEATLVKSLVARIQFERRMWKPIPSVPRSLGQLFTATQHETHDRISRLLSAIQAELPVLREGVSSSDLGLPDS